MSRRRQLAFAAALLPVVAALVWLGVWQLQRRTWKLALIAQVEHRLAAPPAAAPGPAAWARIGAEDAYTRIAAHGRWRAGADTFVQAVTDLGSGYWVMTPLDETRGFTLLVNRGFVSGDARATLPRPPSGAVAVTGLLRVSEPGGAFLHHNQPTADRWYSRDVAAIAAKRGLGRIAPYFIDADARTSPATPRGGLTVVRFPNNHLQYALTWFAMALALGGALVWLVTARAKD